MDTLRICNADERKVDKETLEAQKQWELSGSVPTKYLESVLGDISKSVSVSPRESKGKRTKSS